jgi:molecular chaperone GrpE
VADDNQEQNVSGLEENLPAPTPEAQIASLTADRDQLAAEMADLKDRLLRSMAEFDNFRRRAERDRSEYIQFAAMEIVRDLVPVLDDFRRAMKVETAGKRFDPNLHQAVDRVQTDEVEDQTVLEEYQSGYSFKGKLLRPAMVKVAVKP